ncbi:uncharacterized protein LOC128724504 [Anopheles nili]|uniref:uncharacterized protein LOC128724504 n=1 Tax=Anopheles nili TaxID=185578 RepID=UPI00237B857F|nr:uncharacterized protein LOC128724504 [Anopheles nili]
MATTAECSGKDAPRIPRVDVVFLAYNRDAPGKQPTVTLDSICTVSLYKLQRHLQQKRTERHSMGVDAYQHYKWYNAALVAELRTKGGCEQTRPLLRAFHWYIETSNRAAFQVEQQLYDAVSLVVAAEVEHWYCARAGQHASGSRARVSFGGQEHPKLVAGGVGPIVKDLRRRPVVLRTLERIGEEV